MADSDTNNIGNNNDEELQNLSRAECMRILGLPEDADDEAVKFRYGALLRQYKKKVDEYGSTYEDLAYYRKITAAYDTVFGFTHDFADDNPTSPIPFKIRKRFGKFATWFEQYRLVVMLGAVIILLAVVFIVQNVNRDKTDMKLKFVGAYMQSLDVNLTKQLDEKSEVFDNAQITFFTVTTETNMLDAQARAAAESFLGQLMADGQLDVVLIDKESYEVYVRQYAFMALDEIYQKYCETHSDSYLLEIYEYDSFLDDEGMIVVPQGIYGIDVSSTKFFEDTGLVWLYNSEKGQEKTMIFCIARRSNNVEKSAEFLDELLNYGK